MAVLVAKGAVAAASVSAATEASDFVILSLNHADIVKDVVFGGADGVVQKATADKLLIDMSSIDPTDTAVMAKKTTFRNGNEVG